MCPGPGASEFVFHVFPSRFPAIPSSEPEDGCWTSSACWHLGINDAFHWRLSTGWLSFFSARVLGGVAPWSQHRKTHVESLDVNRLVRRDARRTALAASTPARLSHAGLPGVGGLSGRCSVALGCEQVRGRSRVYLLHSAERHHAGFLPLDQAEHDAPLASDVQKVNFGHHCAYAIRPHSNSHHLGGLAVPP